MNLSTDDMKRPLLITLGVVVLLGGVTAIALPTILHKAGLHPEYVGVPVELSPGKRALVITTSHGVLSEPGTAEGAPSGVMASEFTHPYYNFIDAGIEVDLASIVCVNRGQCRSGPALQVQRYAQFQLYVLIILYGHRLSSEYDSIRELMNLKLALICLHQFRF